MKVTFSHDALADAILIVKDPRYYNRDAGLAAGPKEASVLGPQTIHSSLQEG